MAVDNTLPGRPETFTVEVPFDPEMELHLVGSRNLQGVEEDPLLKRGERKDVLDAGIGFRQPVDSLLGSFYQREVGGSESRLSRLAMFDNVPDSGGDLVLQGRHFFAAEGFRG